jgi:hypothetical protein
MKALIRRLAELNQYERKRAKDEILVWFRRAEWLAANGGISDRNHRSRHNQGRKAVIKTIKEIG